MHPSDNELSSRRKFIKQTGAILGSAFLMESMFSQALAGTAKKVPLSAHLWVYASAFPPTYDCYHILDKVFSDLSAAGLEGVELTDNILKHDTVVKDLQKLAKKYKIPVTGSSYTANMWDASTHADILKDVQLKIPRLGKLKGKTLGISVGPAGHIKTEKELDAQAEILKKIIPVCQDNGIELNLHNHTYEIENDMHDLKGTMARIPGIKLGPDLDWLKHGGIDPVSFINTYQDQIVYLHIRDQFADGGRTEYVGQGVTDFNRIAQALKAINYNGRAAIELAYPKDPNFKPKNDYRKNWTLSREHVRETFGF